MYSCVICYLLYAYSSYDFKRFRLKKRKKKRKSEKSDLGVKSGQKRLNFPQRGLHTIYDFFVIRSEDSLDGLNELDCASANNGQGTGNQYLKNYELGQI